MTAIETVELTKAFGERTAVDRLSLSIKKGEMFALLGQNGAGKTTTIKMLSGLLPPTGGDAFLMGTSITNDADKVKSMINVSPQETAVAPRLSVKENLELIARVMLESFGLADRAKKQGEVIIRGYATQIEYCHGSYLISKHSVSR